jgi:hypothetical protein
MYFKETVGIFSPTLMAIFLSFLASPGDSVVGRIGRAALALKRHKKPLLMRGIAPPIGVPGSAFSGLV